MSRSTIDCQPTVFVVDDEAAARKSVCALVGSFGFNVVSFASGEEFLDAYDAGQPGCLITDIRMLGMTGIDLQNKLRSKGSKLPVIVVTAHADTSLTVCAMKNGAVTLLEKPCREHDLFEAIRDAIAQSAAYRERDRRRIEIKDRLDLLTSSEREVMDMMFTGQLNKQIASQLDVSIRTVESRRHHIFEKMKANSVAELVHLVVEIRDD